jgi:hypothetical protein
LIDLHQRVVRNHLLSISIDYMVAHDRAIEGYYADIAAGKQVAVPQEITDQIPPAGYSGCWNVQSVFLPTAPDWSDGEVCFLWQGRRVGFDQEPQFEPC